MSLNWDARKCGDAWPELDYNTRESLIFACIPVGIGEITEANHLEWYSRYLQWYAVNGWDDPYLSLSDVKAAIGLSTNVFPKVTDAKFRADMAKRLKELTDAKVAKAAKELEEAKNA